MGGRPGEMPPPAILVCASTGTSVQGDKCPKIGTVSRFPMVPDRQRPASPEASVVGESTKRPRERRATMDLTLYESPRGKTVVDAG